MIRLGLVMTTVTVSFIMTIVHEKYKMKVAIYFVIATVRLSIVH